MALSHLWDFLYRNRIKPTFWTDRENLWVGWEIPDRWKYFKDTI